MNSMASVVQQLPGRPPAINAPSISWAAFAWFSALLVAAYFPVLRHLVEQWSNDENVSHGFFVPAVALYIAWQRRDSILAIERRPAWWGLAIMGWGAVQGYVGVLGAELFLQRTSFLITLVGLLLVVGGTQLVRVLAFPLLLLPFMIPIPAIVFNQITFPLQLFASQVAETALGWIGIPVLRDGNILELASQRLSVAEACSGIRSLLSLSFLSLVYAYFFDGRVWMRWVLLIATVPIAILANAGRVTLTGIMSEVNPDLARGFFHSLEGWIIFLTALVMLVGLHVTISRVVKWAAVKEHSIV
jgi:exosortase